MTDSPKVSSTPPKAAAAGAVWTDPKTPGLRLRFFQTKAVWYLYFRTKAGKQRNMVLADERVLTLTAARERARSIREAVSRGEDPAALRSSLSGRPTLKMLRDRHISDHAEVKNKPSWVRDQKSIWDNVVLPFLGEATAVADVTEDDIARLHHSRRHVPTNANRMLSILHKAFNLAEKWKMRPRGTNPVSAERYPEKKRKRFPRADEAVRLLKALDAMRPTDPHFVALVELLCLTGARLNEIMSSEWEWVTAAGLELPDSKTGSKTLALSTLAREALDAIPRVEGNPYIIVGKKEGGHLVSPAKQWARLMKAAGITENLRRHDLRRFFASAGLSEGLGLSQVGDLLGHMEPSTTKRYAFLLTDASQAGAEVASAAVRRRMKGEPAAKAKPETSTAQTAEAA